MSYGWHFATKYGILTQKGLIQKWQETGDIGLYQLICEMEENDE